MVASRCRPKGVKPFGLAILTFLLAPTAIGSQELAALVARAPAIAERPRANPFGMAQVATLNMPRPMSAAMPVSLSYTLAGLDTSQAEIIDSIRERMLGEAAGTPAMLALPLPDRRLKGDRLPLPEERSDQAAVEPAPNDVAELQEPSATVEPEPLPNRSDRIAARPDDAPSGRPSSEASPHADGPPAFQLASADSAAVTPPSPAIAGVPSLVESDDEGSATGAFAAGLAIENLFSREEADPAFMMGRLYFGGAPMGETLEAVQPWRSGAAPNVETLAVSVDAEVQTASLTPDPPAIERPPSPPQSGETIASKGQVTGEGQRPMTPAERLNLNASNRARQERCLASASPPFLCRNPCTRAGPVCKAESALREEDSQAIPGGPDACRISWSSDALARAHSPPALSIH